MAPISLSLGNTIGAAFIGNILAACLYGLTTLQTYVYYGKSRKDSATMKSLVAFLWILDTVHLIMVTHTVYHYAITNFGDFLGVLKPTWSVLAQVIVTGVSDGIIRGIWILSDRNRVLCSIIAITSVVSFGCSLAYPIKGFSCTSYVELQQFAWLFYFSLSMIFAADLIIAASMCALLARRRSSYFGVDQTIRTLILFSVNTGVVTTLCTLMALIAYAVSPHTFIYIAFYFLLPKPSMHRSHVEGITAQDVSSSEHYRGPHNLALPAEAKRSEAGARRIALHEDASVIHISESMPQKLAPAW
ncbi:uncharacterized protein TRAVEDRAFT_50222 [Trametes versicolor FP-101664 SS1]|uniref:uncharacterized protein n=1 Tax=Trametes versicolor (strain FP-101664) TaxID=717944 RepID=UPI000462372C|nr:uncharacterized protein TRAVEDRAFT_50222 [Trametes versicolor FP-101664 SS1]EIW55741.1 hypothetical protein TRAVEDRAFT_50222 [Trametes versicolor FP-101664 SS1]